jgi:hypothetical protein
MTHHNGGDTVRATERIATILATLASVCATLVATAAVSVALPASAGAYASVGPVPVPGSPGLPDGRVYEEVSPPNKNGNAAGAPTLSQAPMMLAEPAGEGVAYNTFGPIGEAKSGLQYAEVAKRGSEGWTSYGAQPRSIGKQAAEDLQTNTLGFSADLTKVLFSSYTRYLAQAPFNAPLLYDIPDGSVEWLNPPPASGPETGASGYGNNRAEVAGFSTDMSTFYFRTESGFYEWHEGILSDAGVLPDGSVEPAALAAGLPQIYIVGSHGDQLRNQVSEDGDDAFFVSGYTGRERASSQPEITTPQLYVRETAPDGSQSTMLVSRDTLLAPINGLPAPAPHGVLEIKFPVETVEGEAWDVPPSDLTEAEAHVAAGFVYASPDGARAFFVSEDQLTSSAPSGGGMYEFDTVTGSLTYLPGVGASAILASSRDGSRFIFNGAEGVSLWSEEGPEGGTVTLIEPFPVGGEARATPDGSVFAFESSAPIAGFNNGGSHPDLEAGRVAGSFRNQEIYRYDVAENSLNCVSCPPKGVVPSGNAYMSHDTYKGYEYNAQQFAQTRGISENGSRVFFDSPDPLVSQVANTAPPTPVLPNEPNAGLIEHGRNVYEWENGRIFLISTGTSPEDSYVGDESANGNDVFFSTDQGLVPGDTDEAYDVYDARVPRPGDRPPPPPAPCSGDVCQGPPSVPDLLEPPASATFSGLGNPTPEPAATPAVKPKAKGCKKGSVKKKDKCVRPKVKQSKAKKSTRGRK